jgi:hypothetical protein
MFIKGIKIFLNQYINTNITDAWVEICQKDN